MYRKGSFVYIMDSYALSKATAHYTVASNPVVLRQLKAH